ncbi:hypothetical protein NPIL_12661 [Nephila pilipes]|uniref:Uncharacterized protein n=1 Tax=Nephila pilipes TaxID=299642 RepID=A0A8X6P0J9_NEPPI|nr:hypothetical protein NPIL_12661 [Nephila pilipes]
MVFQQVVGQRTASGFSAKSLQSGENFGSKRQAGGFWTVAIPRNGSKRKAARNKLFQKLAWNAKLEQYHLQRLQRVRNPEWLKLIATDGPSPLPPMVKLWLTTTDSGRAKFHGCLTV